MSLYERLCHRDESGFRDENLKVINNTEFVSALIEYTYESTQAAEDAARLAMISRYSLTPDEILALDNDFLSLGANQASRRALYDRIEHIIFLAESNYPGCGLPSQLQAKIQAL